MPEFKFVRSAHLMAVAKDGDDLLVEFNSGAVWRYVGAGALYDEFVTHASPGSLFHAKVRGKFEDVREDAIAAERREARAAAAEKVDASLD